MISVGMAGVLVSIMPRLTHSYLSLAAGACPSSSVRIGVYDCLYVALAEREQCELITADDRLVRSMQPLFPFVVSLASL